ncbi:hypothetical protein LXM25_15870 [Dyadobacter sp. LJ53]|uniref:hypothetical protein n=1 Tax=Dyadobacter chenwenxiniae TaxID=2906456 RepID=UPI001F1F35C4|nr:hypothetical protein [Dyadobacter chenwenxiniae]MCF0051545.1 hypothetical protein [Dyadobacter chenwenxiniae]
MNQIFNIHRFALVVKLDLVERGKNYLLIALLLTILLLSLMLPIVTSSKPSGTFEALHYMAMFMVMLFASSFYTSSAMTHYAAAPTSISNIMLPASHFEKFLSALFFNLLFVILFLVLYFQLHYRTIDIANAKLPSWGYKYPYMKVDLAVYFSFAYFMLHSIIFLGSIYFSKRSYVKTAAFTCVAVLVVFTIHFTMSNYLTHYPSKLNTLPFASWQMWYFNDGNFAVFLGLNTFYIQFPETVYRAIQGFITVFILSIWYIAYLRLKEKEV